MLTLSSISTMITWVFLQLIFASWWLTSATSADLIVNVRNQGGESYKQTIRANLSDETVSLHFDSFDGTATTMIIDFRNGIQLLHTTRLGNQEELELPLQQLQQNSILEPKRKGKAVVVQPQSTLSLYRSYCFVTLFKPTDFIPVDAMAKLRQKNPWSLRTPERTEPSQNISFDIMLDATASDWISPSIREQCQGGNDFQVSTYAIKAEISEKAVNPEDFIRAVRDLDGEAGGLASCWEDETGGGAAAPPPPAPCTCSVSVCIGWYPCALKFCRARNSSSSGNNSSSLAAVVGVGGGGSAAPTPSSSDGFKTYRCGIHTCRICRNYQFSVRGANECV